MFAGVCHKGHVPVLGFFEPPLVFVNNNNHIEEFIRGKKSTPVEKLGW